MKALGVPSTPQLVLPLQDCCVFQLVPLCTTSTVEAMSRHMWLPPLPNICCIHHNFGIPGWVPTKAVQPKTQVETCLSCDPSLQVYPSTFSWNASMVLCILKEDPALRDLEHVQVDSPGTAYLFFYDKQGCWGLKQDAVETLQAHVEEAFSEWISHFAHFVIILLLLVEGWQRAMAASDRHCQRSRVEYPNCLVPHMVSSESDSTPLLVGSAPPSAAQMGKGEEGGGHAPGHLPHGQERDPQRHTS